MKFRSSSRRRWRKRLSPGEAGAVNARAGSRLDADLSGPYAPSFPPLARPRRLEVCRFSSDHFPPCSYPCLRIPGSISRPECAAPSGWVFCRKATRILVVRDESRGGLRFSRVAYCGNVGAFRNIGTAALRWLSANLLAGNLICGVLCDLGSRATAVLLGKNRAWREEAASA